MKPKWAISTEIFRKPGFPQIDDALRRTGTEFHQCKYDTDTRTYDNIPYFSTECVVLYGPIQFIRSRDIGYLPGAYGFTDDTKTSVYMNYYPKNMFFNGDCIFLPFGMIESNKTFLHDIFGEKLFIRPDSGFKSFTGFEVTIDKLSYELSALRQIKHIGVHEICLISSAKPIKAEYRFVICENQVITGSQYRWDNKLDVRIDVHHECWSFAEKVVKNDWQLDNVYTMDIFLSDNDGPKIGEFNAFACSGLYNCDTDKIVEAVNAAAIKEWP